MKIIVEDMQGRCVRIFCGVGEPAEESSGVEAFLPSSHRIGDDPGISLWPVSGSSDSSATEFNEFRAMLRGLLNRLIC